MNTNDTIQEVQTSYGLLALDRESDKKMLGVLERGAYPNEELLLLVQRFLTPESVVADVGAHVGTFSIPLRCAKVIAFEPAPDTFSLLQRNTSKTQGVFDIRNKGLAAKPGRASVVERNASNAGAQTLVSGGNIVVSTLDAEVERADFIKIDVEGMEEEVLLGGVKLFETCKPTVLFEVNLSQLRAHHSSPRALERFFKRYGYVLYFPLEQGGVQQLSSIWRLGFLTSLIAPRAWFLRVDSAPFDVLAVARERDLPIKHTNFLSAVVWAVGNNVKGKVRRFGMLLKQ